MINEVCDVIIKKYSTIDDQLSISKFKNSETSNQ